MFPSFPCLNVFPKFSAAMRFRVAALASVLILQTRYQPSGWCCRIKYIYIYTHLFGIFEDMYCCCWHLVNPFIFVASEMTRHVATCRHSCRLLALVYISLPSSSEHQSVWPEVHPCGSHRVLSETSEGVAQAHVSRFCMKRGSY